MAVTSLVLPDVLSTASTLAPRFMSWDGKLSASKASSVGRALRSANSSTVHPALFTISRSRPVLCRITLNDGSFLASIAAWSAVLRKVNLCQRKYTCKKFVKKSILLLIAVAGVNINTVLQQNSCNVRQSIALRRMARDLRAQMQCRLVCCWHDWTRRARLTKQEKSREVVLWKTWRSAWKL